MAKIQVRVVTPERVVWTGEATSLIARGGQGEVGILPGHAPLLMDLGIGILRVDDDGALTRAAVHGGFLHVLSDEGETMADVLAEAAELPGEVDLPRAERARDDAERQVADTGSDMAKEALARALVRLRLGA